MLKGYGKAYNYLTRMVVAVTPSSRGINTYCLQYKIYSALSKSSASFELAIKLLVDVSWLIS